MPSERLDLGEAAVANLNPSTVILVCEQELMTDPNPNSPAQSDAFLIFTQNKAEYSARIKRQTSNYPPPQ